MPKISSYPLTTTVTDQDLFVISDSSNNDATKSLQLETLKTYINEGEGAPGVMSLTAGLDNVTNDPTVYVSASSGNVTVYGATPRIDASATFSDSEGIGVQLQLKRYLSNGSGATNYTPSIVRLVNGNNIQLYRSTVYSDISQIQFNTIGDTITELTTTGTSGAATFEDGVLNIPQYSGGGSGGDTYDLNAGTKSGNSVPLNLTSGSGGDNSVVNLTEGSNITLTQTSATEITIDSASPTGSQLYKTTFTGNTLVNAFNGNLSDKIVLVSVPPGKIAVVENALFIIKAGSTGTTNYNANNTLYVLPEGATSGWGVRLQTSALNASSDYVSYANDSGTGSGLSQYGGVGADIILGPPGSGGGGVDITQGDRDVVVSVVYRIVDYFNNAPGEITIGNLIWKTENSVITASSGGTIPIATNAADMVNATNNSTPMAAYWNFDSNNSDRGLFYNQPAAASITPPSGFRLPTQSDYSNLANELDNISGVTNDVTAGGGGTTAYWNANIKSNSNYGQSGFNAIGAGASYVDIINNTVSFTNQGDETWWHAEKVSGASNTTAAFYGQSNYINYVGTSGTNWAYLIRFCKDA